MPKVNPFANAIAAKAAKAAYPQIEPDLIGDMWSSKESQEERENKILDIEVDPLVITCALIRDGGHGLSDIHLIIEQIGLKSVPDFEFDYNEEDIARADTVRQFFKNSIMMRRLKGLHVSEFMENTEELLGSKSTIKYSHIKILVKLPFFYDEEQKTTEILRGRKSLVIYDNNNLWDDFDCIVTPVGKVHRIAKNDNTHRYYFANENNEIIAVHIKSGDQSLPVWEYLHSKEKFGIKGNARITHQPGHEDFKFYKVSNQYEIYDS